MVSETPRPELKKKRRWFFFGSRDDNQSIVVQKSGAEAEKDLAPAPGGGGVRWQYLTPAVRKAIDDARVARNRWKYIIVHNSGTRQGNARIFDYYHRYVRRMPNGLAYHFVIGNGTSSGNGQVEIGNRWNRQLNGGHVHSDYLNYISIGICLVGDFNRDLPTKAEYEALDELIRYLRRRVGKVDGRYSIVRGHREINPRPTDCPGNRFPLNWLHKSFPD
jgi:N-acetylmuramoyl-L-alanine amidase